MPLYPEPETNIPIDNFLEIYKRNLRINSAIVDGAIMIKMPQEIYEKPKITSWAYRLWPPPLATKKQKNRGSGYNSSIDFSLVDNVEAVYLVKVEEALKFKKGLEILLHSNFKNK